MQSLAVKAGDPARKITRSRCSEVIGIDWNHRPKELFRGILVEPGSLSLWWCIN